MNTIMTSIIDLMISSPSCPTDQSTIRHQVTTFLRGPTVSSLLRAERTAREYTASSQESNFNAHDYQV